MINIVYASDDNYVPFLAVAITSVCENNNVPITIYVLDNNISDKNKQFLKTYEERYEKIVIVFIECSNLEEKLDLSQTQTEGLLSMNITTYSRLFISSLLPDAMEKVLYLDCDALVLDSLEELWSIDVSDYMCAGVDDPAPIPLKESIGLCAEDTYVNAGVLLINLKRWRETNIDFQFLEFLKEYYGKSINHDQGIINGVLKNQILKINPKFNLMAYFYGFKDVKTVLKWNGCTHYYDEELVHEAERKPVIKHCKPWQSPEDYEKYIRLSKIKNKNIFETQRRTTTKLGLLYEFVIENKVGKFFLRIFPASLAVKLKNYVVKKQISE